MKATLIEPGLWAGPYGSLGDIKELEDLAVVVSILPISTRPADHSVSDIRSQLSQFARWQGHELAHRVLVMGDVDGLIPAEHIAHALSDSRPTLIHCNAGENRSTAMAACWLLLHRHLERTPREVLLYVMGKRGFDLGRDPRVSPQMGQNVARFFEWVRSAL